jgi:hypothetical protein
MGEETSDDAWWSDVSSLQERVLSLTDELNQLKDQRIPELETLISTLQVFYDNYIL